MASYINDSGREIFVKDTAPVEVKDPSGFNEDGTLKHNRRKDGTMKRKAQQPSRQQFEDRLFKAEELVRSGQYRDYVVRKMLVEQFKIPRDTAAGYVTRVRKWLREEASRPIEEMRVDSYTTYKSIVDSSSASEFARIKAQSRIDRVFGLDRPVQVDIRGQVKVDHQHSHVVMLTDLDAVLTELGMDSTKVKRALLERVRQRKDDPAIPMTSAATVPLSALPLDG